MPVNGKKCNIFSCFFFSVRVLKFCWLENREVWRVDWMMPHVSNFMFCGGWFSLLLSVELDQLQQKSPRCTVCLQRNILAATFSLLLFLPSVAEREILHSCNTDEKTALHSCPVNYQWLSFCDRSTSSTLTTDIKCNVVFPCAVCNQVIDNFFWILRNAFIHCVVIVHGMQRCAVSVVCWLEWSPPDHCHNQSNVDYLGFKDEDFVYGGKGGCSWSSTLCAFYWPGKSGYFLNGCLALHCTTKLWYCYT